MNILRANRAVIRKTFVFAGRSSRSEYWWFFATVFVIAIFLAFADIVIFRKSFSEEHYSVWPLSACFYFLLLVPFTSVEFRRLHDIGLPGWPAVLSSLVGVTNLIRNLGQPTAEPLDLVNYAETILTIGIPLICLLPSRKNENRYGPNPAHEVSA